MSTLKTFLNKEDLTIKRDQCILLVESQRVTNMNSNFNSPASQLGMGIVLGTIFTPVVVHATEAVSEPKLEYGRDEFVNCKCYCKQTRTVRLIRAPKRERLL